MSIIYLYMSYCHGCRLFRVSGPDMKWSVKFQRGANSNEFSQNAPLTGDIKTHECISSEHVISLLMLLNFQC